MKTLKVPNNKIDAVSDFISRIIYSYEEDLKLEGVYANCYATDGKITEIELKLVYIDYRFILNYSTEELEKICADTGIKIKIDGINYSVFSVDAPKTEKRNLQNGIIIFDRQKNLARLQATYKLYSMSGQEPPKEPVLTEPPIQYKNKSLKKVTNS